jgi:hypothetical protein
MPPMVEAGSVERLCENHRRKDMVSVEEAAVQFSLADKTFESLWIKSGVLNVHNFGLWR